MPHITTFSHMNLYIEINSSKMFADTDKTLQTRRKLKKKKENKNEKLMTFLKIIFTNPKK